MSFRTDRQRAVGLGAAKSGPEHHWHMITTSIALLILIPLFVLSFGNALGGTYEEVLATYSRPYPSIIAGLTLVVGLIHFKNGAQVLIEDYVGGIKRKFTIIVVNMLSYTLIAAGLFGLVKLAL